MTVYFLCSNAVRSLFNVRCLVYNKSIVYMYLTDSRSCVRFSMMCVLCTEYHTQVCSVCGTAMYCLLNRHTKFKRLLILFTKGPSPPPWKLLPFYTLCCISPTLIFYPERTVSSTGIANQPTENQK